MKDKIKKTAINLFYKKGYFATGVSNIARAIGIRKSSIYYHYQNKEDILVDIFRTTMNDLSALLDERLEGIAEPEARLRAVVSGHVLFHIQRQKEAIIADSELRGLTARNYKEIIQIRDDYERKLQRVIQEGIEAGLFPGQDVKVISYAIITMCTAVCSWFKRSGRLSKENVAEMYADFILKGLKG